MAINFPDSPTNGQVATIGGKNYTYNSTKNTWTPTQVTEADLSTVGSTTVVATHDLLPSSPSAGDMALVSSVNKMYVYFLSGWWLMSSLQNASPSGITGNAAIYDLAADGTPTTVTLSSSDPEGFPIVWSHSVISGSLGGTTVTNVNNVFTITPSTTEADAGTFTLRFAASDGQGGESGSQSQFTLDFVFIVTNSRYTTLLATATGTSDNNNITDASSNNHSITVNGDAHAGTFSPYRHGGYSTYFENNTSYYRATSSSDFDIGGTGDWSYEAWVYPTDLSNTYPRGFGLGPYYSDPKSFGVLLQDPDNGGYITVYWSPNTRHLISSTTLPLHSWSHIMVCRSGNDIGLFFNGTRVAHNSNYTASIPTGNTYLFAGATGNNNEGFLGYIKDVRFINGSHPYDASSTSFNVPTEALEITSNTKFLGSSGLPYEKDISTSDHTITVNGSPSIKPFSPYDYNEYSETDHGGSVYFDGTTDYLLINSPPTLGANDWTFETWYYASNPLTYNVLLSQGPGNNTIVSNFSVSVTGEIWIQTYTTSNVILYNTAAGIINGGVWNHIVLTHDYDGSNGGTYKIYVNGNQVGSNVSYTSGYYWNSGGIAGTALAMAQYRYNTQANGECYFSDWKISNSVTYSSNFTPPTAPLSSSGSVLHIKGTDASIIDKSQGSNLKLVGNTTGSTTQTKFSNTKSMYFDGTGDYLSTLSSDLLRMGTGNFTVECWVNKSIANHKGIWQISSTAGGLQSTNYGQTLALGFQTGIWQIYAGGGSAGINGPSFSLSTNTWYHTAVVRNSGTTKLYIDGTEEISISDSHDYTGTYMVIGGYYSTSYLHHGYIQDLRVTKGLARYTTNFTPPTASLEG